MNANVNVNIIFGFQFFSAFVSLAVFWVASPASAQAQINPVPNISKMYGELALQTNYVDRGLTQSNKGMSIDAGLGYWFGGLGRIGFQANSVSYSHPTDAGIVTESVNSELRAFGEYKFVFSGNSDLRLRNDLVRYFSDDTRNNTLITLDQNFFTYHIIFERDDNFEGTKTHRNWFAFQHGSTGGSSFQWDFIVGYSILEIPGLNNFFDTRVALSYVTTSLTLSLVNTFNSAAAQFNGAGDTSVFFVVAAKF